VAGIGDHRGAGSIGHHHLEAARRTRSIAHRRESAQQAYNIDEEAARSMAQEAGYSTRI
jgi:hypothetical protein